MMKTIAVIGAPRSMGSAIAGSLAKAGYHVLLADPDTRRVARIMWSLRQLLRRRSVKVPPASIEVISCVREASWEADIILLAAPCDAYDRIASKIKDVVTGKFIISMVNSMNRTCDDSAVSAAKKLAQLLPHAKIVSAFSTILTPNFRITRIAVQTTDEFV